MIDLDEILMMKIRAMLYNLLVLLIGFSANAVFAHYPHDIHEFIELSPDYANDHTAFISSKQASSTRPVTALVSRDAGATWEFNAQGMDNLGKLTSAIASPLFDTDQTVLTTSEGQGVYRSDDGGLSWRKFNTGISNLNLHYSAAGLDSQGGVAYFVSATYGGLYRLSSGSSTWDRVLNASTVVQAFAVSPDFSSDQTVLLGDQNGALLLSTDGGQTFNQLTLSVGTGLVTVIKFAPDYATSGEVFIGTTSGLFVSTDYLSSLSPVANAPLDWISALVLSPDYRIDATLFLTTPSQGVFKSADRGTSWELHETGVELVGQTNFHFEDLSISGDYSNDGTIFLATFEGLFRSTDFGNSWVELETRPPTLIMGVAMSPEFAQDGLMLVSTYGGGLYVTEDAGVNWRVSSIGVSSPYLYQVAIRENAGSGPPVLITSHENHLLISEDKGNSWIEKEVSDLFPGSCIASKMGVSPDYTNDKTVYLGCRRDGIVVTHDDGETWSLVLNGRQQLPGGSVMSIALSPDYAVDHSLMFSDQRGYFAKSTDEGLSWYLAQDGLPAPGRWYGGRGLVFSPDYKNDNLIAAVTEQGFYYSLNEASTWNLTGGDSSSPVAQGIIDNIAISPDFANDGTLFTSVRGQGLFRASSNGSGWNQVGADSSGNKYDIQNFVLSPDFANDGLVIGWGHDHLFRSTDRGDSFENFDIPVVRHEQNRKQSVLYGEFWPEFSSSLSYGTSYRASATAGNQVSLMFVGTGVRWIGARGSMLGIADVYLDDVLVSTVDLYNPSTVGLLQQELFAVENLPRATHEIRVVVKGSRNPASSANWVVIDAFDVTR